MTDDGYCALDAAYCDTMSFALAQYIGRRYWRVGALQQETTDKPPKWRMRRVTEFVEAHLDEEIRVVV